MNEKQANQHTQEIIRQLKQFGSQCTHGCWASNTHIYKGKKYCYPHWAAVKHVNT